MPNLNLEIAEIMHGDTEVLKIMKGDVEKWPNLPYDAQVEYLQSDGTAYIDTGIVPDINTQVKFKCKFLQYIANSMISGTRVGSSNAQRFFPLASSSSSKVRFTLGNSEMMATIAYGNTIYEVVFNDSTHSVYLNGNKLGEFANTGYSVITDNTLAIFGTNGYLSHYTAVGCIYDYEIIKGGNAARDYIPVRKDGVGYLYDRVSGQLFGNAAGSGAFTYGNDVISEVKQVKLNNVNYNIEDETARNTLEGLADVATTGSYTDLVDAPQYVICTQAEYNAMASHDADTYYIIIADPNE